MSFQHPEYLFALLAVPVMVALYFFYIRWKKQTMKKIGDPFLVQQLTSNYNPKRFAVKFILFATAFGLMVIALSNPRKAAGSSNVKRNGIDVMIALDVSKSMLAQDIKPSRIERAKQFISKLIDKTPDNRIGIVLFAGRAYLQMPLTSDLVAAKLYLSTAGTDIVPTQGTVISDALQMCYAGFNSKEKKYKSIVLISDGEDHDERAQKTAQLLADEGVVVNTVGVGSAEGATIDDPVTGEPKKDAEGKTVITRLNETELKNIAAVTGGVYQLFSNSDEMADVIDSRLKKMEQHGITETSLASYKNYFQAFLVFSFLLLLYEFFMSERNKKVVVKGEKNIAAAISCFALILPAFSFAQNSSKQINSGNELYRKQQYKEAAGVYKGVTDKTPGNVTAQYNLGNALYKNNSKEDALKAYEQAIAAGKDNKEKAEAWYNKGVVLQNDKKLPECIDAYKSALKLNPTDEDARLNLQKALQQQKQQDQKKEDDKKKDDKKQQQKQQPQPPRPQPNKMSKKEAEEKLKALLQQEKNLQDKLHKTDANTLSKPEKDW